MKRRDLIQILAQAEALPSTLLMLYKKAPDEDPPMREVEPYYFTDGASDVMLRAYQLAPQEGWRFFMLERIASIQLTGKKFHPRVRLDLVSAQIHGKAAQRLGLVDPGTEDFELKHYGEQSKAMAAYHRLITGVLSDMQVTADDIRMIQEFLKLNELEEDHLRAVHYKLFAHCLNGILKDNLVTEAEVEELKKLNSLLHDCGLGILE